MSVPRASAAKSNVSGLAMLEQALGLLRSRPQALILHWLGAVPFWLGLLYYLTDMSRSAYAEERIEEAALLVAFLYVWMKGCHGVAAQIWKAALHNQEPPHWSPAQIWRLSLRHAFWQSAGLVVRPIALAMTLPYAWVSGFFQNLLVLEDGQESNRGSARAWEQAKLWPAQQHVLISLLYACGILIWINVAVGLVFVPWALKTFFDWETIFSRSWSAFQNVTMFSLSLALTQLILGPLWQTAYVLRCFYGAARNTGEDLSLALKRIRGVVGMWLIFGLGICGSASAQEKEPPRGPEPTQLSQRVEEVMQRREYAWRLPKDKKATAEKAPMGWWQRMGKKVGKAMAKWWATLEEWINSLIERLFKGREPGTGGTGVWMTAKGVLWSVIGLAVLGLAWGLWHWWRQRNQKPTPAQVVVAAVDLRAEDLRADALPEDAWLKLAREHASRGEFQLALRASWLASLAHLHGRGLLQIAAYKSNHEYNGELRRRARMQELLLAAFAENLSAFERAWYGRKEVTQDGFANFSANLEKIRTC